MSKSIYDSPKVELEKTDNEEIKDTVGRRIDKIMWYSIATLACLDTLWFLVSLIDRGGFTLINLITNYSLNLFLAILLIYGIRVIRGNVCRRRDQMAYRYLSVWGYVWRALLVKFVALVLTLFVLTTRISNSLETPSLGYTIIYNLIFFVICIVLIWGFYSDNRKAQLAWLSSMIRP